MNLKDIRIDKDKKIKNKEKNLPLLLFTLICMS